MAAVSKPISYSAELTLVSSIYYRHKVTDSKESSFPLFKKTQEMSSVATFVFYYSWQLIRYQVTCGMCVQPVVVGKAFWFLVK